MTREQIYLITEKLSMNSESNELFNRNWDFAIYKSLLHNNCNDNSPIEWTVYNDWKINHNMRASKATARKNNGRILQFEIEKIDNEHSIIKAQFISNDQTTTEVFKYNLAGFIPELWQFQNPLGQTILLNEAESETIYNASIKFAIDPAGPVVPGLLNDTLIPEGHGDGVIHFKFHVLLNILNVTRPLYLATENENQKAYYEVIIGAAIFYLPSNVNHHFSGYISIGAIKSYLLGERRVKDHMTPRRLAARQLLTQPIQSAEGLMNIYNNSYAQFMYVSVNENSLLVNYFENHENYDDALIALQIDKFPAIQNERFTNNELTIFLRYIEDLDTDSNILNIETATDLLNQFRNQ